MTQLEKIARGFSFFLANSAEDVYLQTVEYLNGGNFYTLADFEREFKYSKGYFQGRNMSFDEWFTYRNLSNYRNPQVVQLVEEVVSDVKTSIDLGGDFEASKIKFTSIPRGVFSFGLASKGLYRISEYHDVENKRIVAEELVRSRTENGKKIFYYNTPKGTIELRQQQKGSDKVSESCNAPILYSDKARMHVPIKGNKICNGCDTKDAKGEPIKLEYATSIKKIYMYRDKLGGGKTDYVELFCNTALPPEVTDESFIGQNLPIFVVADILEKAGIRTRIYGFRCAEDRTNDIGYGYAYLVKEYGEALDINKAMALVCSRKFVSGLMLFQSMARAFTEQNQTFTSLRSYPITASMGIYRPLFNSYKNYIWNQKGSFTNDTRISDQNLMITGGAPLVDVDKYRDRAIENAKVEVYRILDYVGMLLTKNKRSFIKKVANRRKDQDNVSINSTKDYLKRLIDENIQILLVMPPDIDKYSTPPQEARRIRETVDELIETINEL